jgi:hypothetical protein
MSLDTRPRKYAASGRVPIGLLDDPPALATFMRLGDERSVEGARAELNARVQLHEQRRTISYGKTLHGHVDGSQLCGAQCIDWPATKGVDAEFATVLVEYAIEWPT